MQGLSREETPKEHKFIIVSLHVNEEKEKGQRTEGISCHSDIAEH